MATEKSCRIETERESQFAQRFIIKQVFNASYFLTKQPMTIARLLFFFKLSRKIILCCKWTDENKVRELLLFTSISFYSIL